jgi:bis(5'-nucleosyl)-tetraphosphatase (symmetrical)
LLDKISFDREQDNLWFTGNLVGNGPEPVEVLRFVKSLEKQAVAVLGDQDLRLLAVAEGLQAQQADDQFDAILAANDRDELLKWLRQRPFFHKDSIFTLVHAGIPAEWSVSQARTFAIEAESALGMGGHLAFLENTADDHPTQWHAKHRGWKRLRFITNAFTRMRYCHENGRLDLSTAPSTTDLLPWYRLPNRGTANQNIIFGHWQLPTGEGQPGIFPLDTGCGREGELTAMKVCAAPEVFSVPSD